MVIAPSSVTARGSSATCRGAPRRGLPAREVDGEHRSSRRSSSSTRSSSTRSRWSSTGSSEDGPPPPAHPVGRDCDLARRRLSCPRRGRPGLRCSEQFACPEHGVPLPELQPRIFSFNSPHGACPRCTGSARSRRSTRTCWSRPGASIGEGALVRGRGQLGFYEAVIQGIAERYEIDLDRRGRT